MSDAQSDSAGEQVIRQSMSSNDEVRLRPHIVIVITYWYCYHKLLMLSHIVIVLKFDSVQNDPIQPNSYFFHHLKNDLVGHKRTLPVLQYIALLQITNRPFLIFPCLTYLPSPALTMQGTSFPSL